MGFKEGFFRGGATAADVVSAGTGEMKTDMASSMWTKMMKATALWTERERSPSAGIRM